MIIRDIIELQKREVETLLKEEYIKRTGPNIDLSNSLIKVITGPRRAGKSFFSIYTLSKNNKFGYINFDDEELTRIEDYNELVSAVNSVYGNPKILFLAIY